MVDAESGAALEAAAEAQNEDASEETGEDQTTDEESTDDQQDNADSTEDTDVAGTETVDEIPPATSDDQQTEGQVTEEQPEQTNHNEKILALYSQGKSYVEIAKELGLGQGEVRLVVGLYKGVDTSEV